MAGKRFNPFTYLAVGEKPTALYRFDVLTGQVSPTAVPAYPDGYDALAYRWKDGLLYAMGQADRNTLLVIDPTRGTVTPRKISGVPRQVGTWVLGAMAPDGDRFVVSGSDPSAAGMVLDLSTDPVAVTAEHPPGPGGWYDWAYHPVDGRLYAVDGRSGALLYADPARNPQETVLKAGVFPKAQAGSAGRATFSALFFDSAGRLYAIDNAGNVFRSDLSASKPGALLSADGVREAERVGRVPVAVRDLDVRDAGGDVTEPKVAPQYEEIAVVQKSRGSWEEWDPKGTVVVHSFHLTLTAGTDPVRTWRVFFDAIPGAAVVSQAARVSVTEVEGRFVLDTPGEDHLIEAGHSLDVDLQVRVPKAGGVEVKELHALGARRMS